MISDILYFVQTQEKKGSSQQRLLAGQYCQTWEDKRIKKETNRIGEKRRSGGQAKAEGA